MANLDNKIEEVKNKVNEMDKKSEGAILSPKEALSKREASTVLLSLSIEGEYYVAKVPDEMVKRRRRQHKIFFISIWSMEEKNEIACIETQDAK